VKVPPPEERKRLFDKQVKGWQSFVLHDGRQIYPVSRQKLPDGGIGHVVMWWDEDSQDFVLMMASDTTYQQWLNEASLSEVSPN